MTEPEIARRCLACGASIRESAFFCPQCGKELPKRDSEKADDPISEQLNETIAESRASANDAKASDVARLNETQREFRTESHSKSEPSTRDSKHKTRKKAAKAGGSEAAKASVGQAALGAVGAQIQRATTLARDVEGDVIHRVQKVREISSVVIDEAGYDPSLRFVLVAAVLFLLFLIIVLLNKFIS